MALTRITKGVIKPNENYDTHNINSTGIVTATKFVGPFDDINVSGAATFSGNVSIAGTLTYEDVTNVDSVGIITARDGIHVGAGVSVVGILTASVIKSTNLSSDRVVFTTTGGQLEASGNLTYNGSTLASGSPFDLNADLDVDGHTNLDNVSIAGITTFTNSAGVGDFKPIQLEKSGATGASRIQFLENGTNKGGITYSHDNNRMELIAMSGNDIVFYSGGNLTTRINSSGHVVPDTDSTYDLGLTGTRFRNVYADTLYGDGSNLTGITQTTLNNNANNRIITGSGTANTLEAEATLTYDGTSIFELQPSSATPARFIGDANRTGQGQHLAQFEGNWNGTLVGRMVVVTGEDTSNKDDGHLDFFTTPSGGSHTRRLRIDSSGNIGEGTATPLTPDGSNADNPNNGRVFTIYGDSPAINLIHNTAGGGSAGSTDYAAINFGRNGSSSNPYRAVIGYKQVEDILHINANNHIVFDTGGNINSGERLRIESDGDIGLGTNNPNRSGYGSPVVSIGYNTSNNYSVLELQGNKTSDATIATIVGYNVGGSSRIAEISMGRDSDNNSGVISFLTYDGGSGNERTRIDHDGRLLHGNASNTGVAGHGVRIQSDAVGSNYATGALALRGTGGDFYAITMLGDSGNAWGMLPIFSAGTDYLSFGYYDGPNSSNSGALFRIEEGGNVIATGSIDSASDIKLKTNIKTIDNALDKVLKLRGAEYDRIDKDNKHEIGVIAQEVEKIIPELVNTSEDPDGGETKTVSYGNMVAVLIEAIKEQNEVINKMKKEIEDLKG